MRYQIIYKVNNKKYYNESEYLNINIINSHKIVISPKEKVELVSACLILDYDKSSLLYCNGFQTWTDAGIYKYGMSTPHLGLLAKITNPIFKFKVVSDYSWCKQDDLVSHTYTFLKQESCYRFLGALNDNSGFTSFHFNKELEIHKDVEGKIIKDDFVLFDIFDKEGQLNNLLDEYFSLLNIKKSTSPCMCGYTSWYNHYQNINELTLLDDLRAITSIDGFNPSLFQIDDGYQEYVGDWLKINKQKFPNGLEPIVKSIKDKGLIPGIWLAPFICEKKSQLFKGHPDWILMKGAYNWSGMYHLDINNCEVRNYLHEVFTYYKKLGFRFFKLDFLYAACSIPSYGKSRAEIMYESMDFLRKELSDCYILGCGVPLGAAFGKVDYCRIGQDVSLNDDGPWYMRLCHRERVSTKLAINNTIARAHLDHYGFANDPDVFILRDTAMTKDIQEKLFETNLKYGSLLLTSDNVSKLTKEKQEKLVLLSNTIEEKNKKINLK